MLVAGCPTAWAVQPSFIEYLYIDANVGGSSGGHTAIKLNDWVYHFQNEDGYTQLTRESWHRFRWVYNDLDNRNIHIARVALTAANAERINNRLSLLLLVQKRHAEYMEALNQDLKVLDAWHHNEPIAIDGLGFFQRLDHQTTVYGPLLKRINSVLGSEFPGKERRRLERRLDSLVYVAASTSEPLSRDRFPNYPPTFSEQIQDLLAHRLALDVITRAWKLAVSLQIDEEPLSPSEQLWLVRYQEQIEESILNQFTAPYSGSGKALLLALARYQAVALSLARDRLVLLDTLTAEHRLPRQPLTETEHANLIELRDHLSHRLPVIRDETMSLPEPDESRYHRLEVALSELNETETGLALRQSIHFGHQEGPPLASGYAWPNKPPFLSSQFDTHRQTAEYHADQFLDNMRESYAYQLITHNCVTELASAVNSSFEGGDEREALGGHIEPGADQGFIPFRFFELIRQRYRVTETLTLPSYRNRALAKSDPSGQGWVTAALEASTLTSSIYRPREGDSAFLLFTDRDLWTRPLFGVINLGYAVGAASVGVFTSPVDGGSGLTDGLSGVLFSLPEIGFWNIRKGSFSQILPGPWSVIQEAGSID
ncbi:MAG: hypothetical protein ACKN9W_19325 [Methylococcus sp.]